MSSLNLDLVFSSCSAISIIIYLIYSVTKSAESCAKLISKTIDHSHSFSYKF